MILDDARDILERSARNRSVKRSGKVSFEARNSTFTLFRFFPLRVKVGNINVNIISLDDNT